MNLKKVILSDTSIEAKVSAIAIILDKELPKLTEKVDSVKKLKGEQGDRGLKGDKGDSGRDGKDGKNGKDAKDGLNGKNGQNGIDGVSVVDAKIDFDDTLVLKLSDGKEINAGEVKGEKGDRGEKGNAGLSGAIFQNYGAFSDYQNQTATANTANPLLVRQTDYSRNVTVVDSSKITFTEIGKYNIQWSAEFNNSDTQEHDVSIWLKYNGVDVVGSTGVVGIPSSHGGTAGHAIPSWNFIIDVAKSGDYYEFYWSTPATQVTVNTKSAQINPVRPSTASVVITAQHIGF
jgi:hypothetical protein